MKTAATQSVVILDTGFVTSSTLGKCQRSYQAPVELDEGEVVRETIYTHIAYERVSGDVAGSHGVAKFLQGSSQTARTWSASNKMSLQPMKNSLLQQRYI